MHSHVSHHVQTCIIDGNWGCWAKIWKTCRLKPSISYSRLNVLEPVGDTAVWLFKGHISSPCDRRYSIFLQEGSWAFSWVTFWMCVCVFWEMFLVLETYWDFLSGSRWIHICIYVYIYVYIYVLYQVHLDITSDEFVRKAEQNWGLMLRHKNGKEGYPLYP